MDGKKTRLLYISFAIFCMLFFFIISSLMVKSSEIHYYDTLSEDNTIEVFKEIEKPGKLDSKIFFNILSKSNSHIKLFVEEKSKDYAIYLYDLIKRLNLSTRLKELIKSQFPTILSFNNASIDFRKNKSISLKDEDPEILEDLILVDELMEKEEGELLDLDDKSPVAEGEIPKPQGIDKINVDREKPYILIYHTHGTEAYLPIKNNTYHTTDKTYNVLTIGEIIGKVLTERGHKVRHIETYHDYPSYTGSYSRSLTTANTKLKEEPNLKIVLDVHRDGVPENASYKNKALEKMKTTINEKEVATFSMVIGPETPNKDQVLNFAKYIKEVSDSMYPGLCTGIIVKPKGKFNQFLSDHYVLLEVGSNLNTIDEAKETAVLLGEILNEVIRNIQE